MNFAQKMARDRYDKIVAGIAEGKTRDDACAAAGVTPSAFYQMKARYGKKGPEKKVRPKPKVVVMNIPEQAHHTRGSDDEVNIVIVKGHAGTISAIMANLARAIGNG